MAAFRLGLVARLSRYEIIPSSTAWSIKLGWPCAVRTHFSDGLHFNQASIVQLVESRCIMIANTLDGFVDKAVLSLRSKAIRAMRPQERAP